MNLFIIHCGYYDTEISDGVFEFHINIPIAAENEEEAKEKVRSHPSFVRKQMHVDGIQKIKNASGYRIDLVPDLG
jgi:hypothetical protein